MNEPPTAFTNRSANFRAVLVCTILAAVTWLVFGQTLDHGFVAYDDQNYVYQNPQIISGITPNGLVKAFTDPHARNWHPLTTISHMLDCQLFGLEPAGHHFVNVLLHTTTALLVFSVLYGATAALGRSAVVAAIFAIHPLRVESVAWISERKDVLSGLFFVLTLAAYIHYSRQPSVKRYLWVALLFICGLMSKPMLVTLPLLLLLFDYWPLDRFSGIPLRIRSFLTLPILDKVPLLLLSIVSSVVTLTMQRVTVDYTNQLPVTARLSNAFASYVVYVEQMFWPTRLTVLYPLSISSLFSVKTVLAFLLITAVTAVAIVLRRRIPYLFVGWSWYLICLLPVIGLVQVGLQSHADRYTYLPQIGLAVLIVWAGSDLLESVSKRREISVAVAVVVIGLLTWRATIQASYWKNTESLWTHALDVSPDNDVAHYNIAEQLLAQNHVDDAIAHYEKAINAFPHDPAVHYQLNPAIIYNALGNALARKGLFDNALIHYRKAAELENDFADAHSNVAAMLVRQGHLTEAIAEYEKAVALPPEDADSHVRLAALFLQSGRADLAIAHYRRALELEPASAVARAGLSQCSQPAPSEPKER